jgi:transposase
VFKKNELKPWLKKMWCIPPEHDAGFVACMEDVLEVYQRPYNPEFPQVCMDETSKQLISEKRDPLPPEPGQVERYDGEYVREDTANLFMACEPLAGRRHVKVTDRRKRSDWAAFVKELVDEQYPQAQKIVLVMDNLNTHSTASLYAAFEASEARRIAEKLEIHYTPKHGSWLNMAEIELSVLGRQCLDRRIPDSPTLTREVAAWQTRRDALKAKINWRFTTADARIKLQRLYPIQT